MTQTHDNSNENHQPGTGAIHDIDDPRLTAYALGELDGPTAEAVARYVESSPEARAAVDEIRALAGTLRDELDAEHAPGLDAPRRATLEQALNGGERGSTQGRTRGHRVLSMWLPLVAAAALLVAVVMDRADGPAEEGVPPGMRPASTPVARLDDLGGARLGRNRGDALDDVQSGKRLVQLGYGGSLPARPGVAGKAHAPELTPVAPPLGQPSVVEELKSIEAAGEVLVDGAVLSGRGRGALGVGVRPDVSVVVSTNPGAAAAPGPGTAALPSRQQPAAEAPFTYDLFGETSTPAAGGPASKVGAAVRQNDPSTPSWGTRSDRSRWS